jgi:hypothetical protein
VVAGVAACSANTTQIPNAGGYSVSQAVSPNFDANTTSTTIAYYRFETGPAGQKITTVIDSSGNRRNGSLLIGAPRFSSSVPVRVIPQTGATDKFAASFGSGDASKFSFAFPFDTLISATLEFWVHPNLGSEHDIFWTTLHGGDLNRFNIGLTPSHQAFIDYREANGTLHQLGVGHDVVPAGQWTFIAFVKHGSTYSIYMNGPSTSHATRLESSKIDTAPHLPTSVGWTINGRAAIESVNCCQFSGLLDEVRLSSAALTPKQFLVSKP